MCKDSMVQYALVTMLWSLSTLVSIILHGPLEGQHGNCDELVGLCPYPASLQQAFPENTPSDDVSITTSIRFMANRIPMEEQLPATANSKLWVRSATSDNS